MFPASQRGPHWDPEEHQPPPRTQNEAPDPWLGSGLPRRLLPPALPRAAAHHAQEPGAEGPPPLQPQPQKGRPPWGHSLATWGAQGAEPGAPHGGTAWQAGRGQGVTWKRHWPWPFPSRSVVRKARTTSEREWHLLSGACWFLGCSPEPRGAGRNLQPSSGEATTARAGSSHARGSPGRGVRLGRSRPWEVAAFQLPGLSSPHAPSGH